MRARLQLGTGGCGQTTRSPQSSRQGAQTGRVGGATGSASSCAPGLLGPPPAGNGLASCFCLPLGGADRMSPRPRALVSTKGPEHPEGLATCCLSALESGGGDTGVLRAGRRSRVGRGPGGPAPPHRLFRIRRVFSSPMKNLQKHGPVRSLGESPGLHQHLHAQTSPEFSIPGGWTPLEQEKPFSWRCHLCGPHAAAELPGPRPLSRRPSGTAEGAVGGTWTSRPVPRPRPHPRRGRPQTQTLTLHGLGAPEEGSPQAQP